MAAYLVTVECASATGILFKSLLQCIEYKKTHPHKTVVEACCVR